MDHDSRQPDTLPRARRKLLSIAIALRLSKRLAILDEPTCGMDLPSKEAFVALLNEFPDLAVLLITHDSALDGLGQKSTMEEFLT